MNPSIPAPQGFRAIGPTTFLSPIPSVLVSCRGTQPGFDRDNMITVAWAGIVCSNPPTLSISLKPERHSYDQIAQSGVFCVNLVGQSLTRAADFCGVKSGRDIDKFAGLGLHALAVPGFDAPALAESPLFLCCRVTQRVPLGSHEMFIAQIEQVCVSESLFDADGSVDLARAQLVAYAHGEYYPLKDKPQGFFGYSVARDDVLCKRLPHLYKKKSPAKTKKGGKRP